jgi:hypothetical protein
VFHLIALAALLVAAPAQPTFAGFADIEAVTSNGNVTGVTVKEGNTRVVEWDFPAGVETDALPGAISIEPGDSSTNNVWFVTRLGELRVYKLQIPRGLRVKNAPWTSWRLHPDDLSPAGGLKRVRSSWDRRLVFVRTIAGLHRIDTTTNKVVLFLDEAFSFGSDVSVDSSNRVYWAANTGAGSIRRINANVGCTTTPCAPAEFIEWPVDGGVGLCTPGDSLNEPCLSGLAVNPKAMHLVYFSDNGFNQIGELDTRYDTTRRWDLSGLDDPYDPNDQPPQGPRQLNIDSDGTIWVVTGSGHLVSLNPKTNRLTKHRIPSQVATDPFGVAPDGGLIGYTDSEGPAPIGVGLDVEPDHKVAMLVPREKAFTVKPVAGQATRIPRTIVPVRDNGNSTYGEATPIKRTVPTRITKKADGTFVEALVDKNEGVNLNSSRLPSGIAPDRERATGAFFYAVGAPTSSPFGVVKRIGHTRLPRDREKGKHDRDDEDCDDDDKPRGHDDDDDDDGMKNDVDADDDDDGYMDYEDDDDDNDGIKNHYDTKDGDEDQYNYRSQLAATQFEEFQVTSLVGGLALIVLAVADNPLAPISIEVRNAAGQVVGTSIAAPGTGLVTLLTPAAGTYTVKVKNHGLTSVGIDTTTITRVPRL